MRRFRRFFLLLCTAFAAFAAAVGAEEEMPGDRSGRGGDFRRRFAEINETLRTKYPAEFAEMEKLRETDRRAAMEKFRELAEKAGVSLPMMRRERGGDERFGAAGESSRPGADVQNALQLIRAGHPEAFDENGKLKESDPAAALEKWIALAEETRVDDVKRSGGAVAAVSFRSRHRLMMARADRLLAEMDPEGFEYLTELRGEDPDAARELFRRMLRNAGLTAAVLSRPLADEKPVKSMQIALPDLSASGGNFPGGGNGGGMRRNRGGGFGGWGGPPPGMMPPGGF